MGKDQIKYPEILAGILDRKFSSCSCSPKYLRSPKKNKTGCLFGADCQFSQNCNYEQSKCTCKPECTCSTESDLTSSGSECICTDTCDCKSDSEDEECTCIGICNCNSSQIQIIKQPMQCNKNICTCKSCLCQSTLSSSNLLPNYFRNTVKKEQFKENKFKLKVKPDKSIAQELEEMKQMMEWQRQIMEEFDHIKFNVNTTKKAAPLIKTPSIMSSKSLLPSPEKENEDVAFRCEMIRETERGSKSILNPFQECSRTNTQSKKTPKSKTNKPKYQPENFIKNKSFGYKSTYKPLRIRYYYSGGTEHYGVKLGHKHCLESITAQRMPWQCGGQDYSTYTGGRVPPGFIRKSIKDMMKVMKDASKKSTVKKISERSLGSDSSEAKIAKDGSECEEEPPLIHIHNKGRTYHVTFCPKESDPDIKPIPIPFAFTRKKEEGDSDTSDSTLEFELHSPKLHKKDDGDKKKLKDKTKTLTQPSSEAPDTNELTKLKKKEKEIINTIKSAVDQIASDVSNDKKGKKKEKGTKLMSMSNISPNVIQLSPNKGSKTKEKDKLNKVLKSAGSQENKNLWEDLQTQMQNIS